MGLLTFAEVENHPQVLECIRESDRSLAMLGYTDHGLRHLGVTVARARQIAKGAGLSARETELAAMASFCHDMGNFMGRTQHHYWGSLLFHQIFQGRLAPDELYAVVQAIANHDKEELKFTHKVAAVLVLADKSDVHRSRVRKKPLRDIMRDIHNRVNYAVTASNIRLNPSKKEMDLVLKVDTKLVPVLEYFEIFTARMSYCRLAAEHLGWKFGLRINNFKLI